MALPWTRNHRAAGDKMKLIPSTIMLFLLLIVVPDSFGADRTGSASTVQQPMSLIAHTLALEIDPPGHRLKAFDAMVLNTGAGSVDGATFHLSPALQVTSIRLGEGDGDPCRFSSAPDSNRQGVQIQIITIHCQNMTPRQRVTLQWRYEGAIDDPPREPRHLRFVTPSETSGHIGPEGVYVSGETYWYPDIPGSVATFRVRATVPTGWGIVTQGRRLSARAGAGGMVEEWDAADPAEALTLVANRFVMQHRDWKGIDIETYLFADDASLSEEYLEAAVRYLEAYTALLGPYPFPKFAVVENFFASGLGMPSFTLLGSGVIKRHYTQPYALGHEIVHSWIGNWVLNKPEEGNWVEGLTTYLANYYYDELFGTPAQARDQRRMMLFGYAAYVKPEEDYAVRGFTHKSDQKDNAIGYQKAAMVFHMLRRELGDEVFWRAIRRLVADYGGRYAGWREVEQVFSQTATTDLRWFFSQWIDRAGAPIVRIGDARTVTEAGQRRVRFRLQQDGDPYRLQIPVAVETKTGQEEVAWVRLQSPSQTFDVPLSAQPARVKLDPGYDTFRRVNRRELPPMLNLFVTDVQQIVVLPATGPEAERRPYEELARRLQAGGHAPNLTVSPSATLLQNGVMPKGSVLILGGPANEATAWGLRACSLGTVFGKDSITIGEHSYQDANLAALVSCRNPENPDHVVTLFYAASPAAAAKVARLLFFYGWQSYLVFRDGVVVARGDFPGIDEGSEVNVQ